MRRGRLRVGLTVSSLRHRLRHLLRISQCSALCSSLLLFLYSLLLFFVSVPVAASVIPHPPVPASSPSSDDSLISLHSPISSLQPCYGVYELKGRRHYMEDTHAVYGDGQLYVSRLAASSPFALEAKMPQGQSSIVQRPAEGKAEEAKAVVEAKEASDWLLFGIFDGHGGADASAYTAVHLLPLIHSKLTAYQHALHTTSPAVVLPPPSAHALPSSPFLLPASSNLSRVFHSSFQQVDDGYLHHPLAHHRHHSHADGSTAIVIGVERRPTGERVVVANAGDCRALLVGEDSGEGKEVVRAVNPTWQWASRLPSRLCTRANDSDSDSDSDDGGCTVEREEEEEEEDDEELLHESKTADIADAELLHMYHHFHPPDLTTLDSTDLPSSHSPHHPAPVFLPLSVDHKPHLPLERAYIQSQPAGFITTSRLHSISRVQGVLATSRAIGDYELKPYVRCEPDVVLWEVEGEEEGQERVERMKGRWLVLGSDGFFDAWSSAAVSGWVREMGGRGMGVQAMAKELVKSAYRKGSDDNITVMIVDLHCLYNTHNAKSHAA